MKLSVKICQNTKRTLFRVVVSHDLLVLLKNLSFFLNVVVMYFESYFKGLYFILSFVFVSLSGSRLVWICPHKRFPMLILCFYFYLNFCLALGFT